jgi:signal transduction histidine kinase
MLATPLVYENEAIGVLSLYVDKPYRFNDDERLLARALADLGAIAIENARLYGRVFDTEESLRKSERLTTLGMLAAEIAHEIRNPLMVLRLLFDSIKSGAMSEDETEKDLEVIRDKLNHLEQIAGRILDFGKDRESIRLELSISELLDDVLRLVRLKLARAKVEMRLEDSPMDLVVMADKGQLQQALLNLILNALAAMPDGGLLSIAVEKGEGRRVVICVRDSGSGIPEELRDRIFESFLTGRKEGTGLGLAISKRILKSHEGDLELLESSEQGTTFRLILPLVD